MTLNEIEEFFLFYFSLIIPQTPREGMLLAQFSCVVSTVGSLGGEVREQRLVVPAQLPRI